MILGDESGFAGFKSDLKGTKCCTFAEYREEVFRYTSGKRKHVTIFPVIVVLLGPGGEIERVERVPNLWVFSREYLSTKLANSQLDPANNIKGFSPLKGARRAVRKFEKDYPKGCKPENPIRYLAASASGNVNSTIIYNFHKDVIIPFLRDLGVTKAQLAVQMWDMHSSHTPEKLLQLKDEENIKDLFLVPHTSERTQIQDQGEFKMLKTQADKDIDAWNIYLKRSGRQLQVEDFPFVVTRALKKSQDPKVTQNDLRRLGFIPFNPDLVLKKFPNAKKYQEYKEEAAQEAAKKEAAAKKAAKEGAEKNKAGVESVPDLSEDEASDVAWQAIGSDPSANRAFFNLSPSAVRLKQDPFEVKWDSRFNAFDFDGQETQRKLIGLVHQTQLNPAAKTKRGQRGKRVGEKGQIFTAEDIRKQRDEAQAKREKKKAAQQNKKKKERDARAKWKAKGEKDKRIKNELRAQNKNLRKQLAALKRKKRIGQRRAPEGLEEESDEDQSEENEPEDESEKEGSMGEPVSKRRAVPSRRSKTKVVNYADDSSGSAPSDSDTGSDKENARPVPERGVRRSGKNEAQQPVKKKSRVVPTVSEDDDEISAGSNSGGSLSTDSSDITDDEAIGDAVAPPGFMLQPAAPHTCNIKTLKNSEILYRYEAPTAKGWFHGKVVKKASSKHQKKGFDLSIRYTKKGTQGKLYGDVPTRLARTSYGKMWFVLRAATSSSSSAASSAASSSASSSASSAASNTRAPRKRAASNAKHMR